MQPVGVPQSHAGQDAPPQTGTDAKPGPPQPAEAGHRLEAGTPAEHAPAPCGKKRYIICDTCCGCCCAVVSAVVAIVAVAILGLYFNTWPATEFTNVKYAGPDGVELHAYVAKPKTGLVSGKAPAAIIFHAWNGMSEEPTYFADRLAELGYYAIAPDLFRNVASSEGNLIRNIINVVNAKQSRMNDDADAALKYLRSLDEVDESKIVSGPGFCFGGTQSLEFAKRHQTAGTVTCYGTGISDYNADQSDARWGKLGKNSPVLGIYGELDTRPSPKQAESFKTALEARSVAHNVTIYPGVGHAFITPHAHRDAKHEGHAQAVEAWSQIVQFAQSVQRSSPPPDSGARRARGSLQPQAGASHARAEDVSHWNPAVDEDRSLYHRTVCAFKCALDVLKGSGHWQHRALPTFGLDKLLASV